VYVTVNEDNIEGWNKANHKESLYSV